MLHSSAQDMSHFPFLNIVPLYFFRDKNVLLTIEIKIKLSIYTVMLCCFSYKGINVWMVNHLVNHQPKNTKQHRFGESTHSHTLVSLLI